jgi:hypothetical protein
MNVPQSQRGASPPWAVQQRKLSSWDFDYQKYGIWKYARARMLFNDPRWNDWLRQI